MKTTTTRNAARLQQPFVFDDNGLWRLFDNWREAAAFLGVGKHEYYFALNNGTPVGNRFIDIYVGNDERKLMLKAEMARAARHHSPKEGATE